MGLGRAAPQVVVLVKKKPALPRAADYRRRQIEAQIKRDATVDALRGRPPKAGGQQQMREDNHLLTAHRVMAVEDFAQDQAAARLAGMTRCGVRADVLVASWREVCSAGEVRGRVSRLCDALNLQSADDVRRELRRLRNEFPGAQDPIAPRGGGGKNLPSVSRDHMVQDFTMFNGPWSPGMAKKERAADSRPPLRYGPTSPGAGVTSNVIAHSVIATLRAAERLVDQVGSQPLRDPIAYPDDIDSELRRFMELPGVAVVVESVHRIQAHCAMQQEIVDERKKRNLKTLRKGDV